MQLEMVETNLVVGKNDLAGQFQTIKQKDEEKEGASSVVGRIDSRKFTGVTGILQKRNRREETIGTLIRADDFLSK